MKASEMTNEMLAECIESARLAPAKYVRNDNLNFHREAILEAASRLRRQDITIAAQKANGAAEGYAHGCEEVADLRRRLKIAEDARPVPDSPNICDKANLVIREFEKVATRRPDGLTVIDCECSRLGCAVEELKEALGETSCEGKR